MKEFNSYYEYFHNYLFPIALEYGMTSDEFWKDDPNLFIAYRISFSNKKKREAEENNFNFWLQGLYIHESNSICSSDNIYALYQVNGVKQQYKKHEYPKQPYNIFENANEEKSDKINKNTDREEYYKSFNNFAQLKQKFVEKIKKGE